MSKIDGVIYYGTMAILFVLLGCTLALCTMTLQGCSIPDVDDIHLTECLRPCSDTRRACIAGVEASLEYCENVTCAKSNAIRGEACWSDYTDCVEDCIAETEGALK